MRSLSVTCLLAAAAALALGCDGGPTRPADPPKEPSLAVTSNNHFHDVESNVVNDCTGEEFAVVGDRHVIFALVESRGGAHFEFHANFHFEGTSLLTGVSYIANVTLNGQTNGSIENGHLDAPVHEETFQGTFILVAQGSAPNEVLQADFHVLIHSDGTVSSFIDNLRILCQ
jgi:hypothetical protein